MTYEVLVTAAEADEWKRRVKAALIKAAIAISVDSPSEGINTRRDTLARQVMLASDVWTNRFALPTALGFEADSDLLIANVTDAEIDTRISSIFNDFIT